MDEDTSAEEVIERLGLEGHPEGGWFRATWADEPADGSRGAASVIHFLLRDGEVSRWHRVDAAEVWTHVAGAPLELSWTEEGRRRQVTLGEDLAAGHHPHAVVPTGQWQAARPVAGWALVSCVVAPAFTFDGFEMVEAGPDDPPPA